MQNLCPRCKSPIPADAPGGLCPACVLLGVAGPTNPSQASAANAPSIEEIAAAFPELEVLELIGQGGMGVVFKARQPRLDRLVALKILPPALASQPGFSERFTREARVLARLAHPHIVAIYDFGESAGFFYLIMEFVNGVNLRSAMRAGVTPEQALLLVPRICEALQFAHDHGVLHRDIKPENILLDTSGTPKLADFGIAKLAGEEAAKTGLTATGAALGTAAYMAPEQVEKPATVDHRADIYSLGVVLYEMLTGELPLGRFAVPSEKSTVNRGVDEVVMRALEKERERRQQSAGEMKTQVEHAATHHVAPVLAAVANPWPNRLFWLIVSMLVLPAVAVFTGIVIPHLTMAGNVRAWAVILVALLPFLAVAALVFFYRRTRPGADRATPRATWNPWPKRVFLLVLALVGVPAMLVGLGIMVPRLAYRSLQTPAMEDRARKAELEAEVQREMVAMQDEAIRSAHARLDETKKLFEAGLATQLDMLAAERNLAVTEARDDELKVATALATYAEMRSNLVKEQVRQGVATPLEGLNAEQELNTARIRLQKARNAAGPPTEPALEKPAKP